jgi:hypothetical protein
MVLTADAKLWARREAEEIVAYWAARGYVVEAWVEEGPWNQTHRFREQYVRSNLVNGLPAGYCGDRAPLETARCAA